MRASRIIMGTGVSVDIPVADPAIFGTVFRCLKEIDERFSTYRRGSEVSRYVRGELKEEQLSAELKKIIAACKQAELDTDGYFSAWAAGSFDPSGYVKGWAIEQGAAVIEQAGYKTFCVGIGGDILARSDGNKIWDVGILDPNNQKQILNKLSISNRATATSGNYERGAHIINPKTKKPANSILSITVVGPSIITADILATAAFVQGQAGLKFIENQPGYEALMVNKLGQISMTGGMQVLLA